MKTENTTAENSSTAMFHVQNSLKQGPASSPLLLTLLQNMTLVQANQEWGPGFCRNAAGAFTLLGLLDP
jgi:hypothetical protein